MFEWCIRFTRRLIASFFCLLLAHGARAATYYVSPNSAHNILSIAVGAPGSLEYAVGHAPAGSTIILENGTYDGAPAGYTVGSSHITFRAQSWHGARITNSTGANLWGPTKQAVDDTCLGVVFGPCVTPMAEGWSGGGGDGWQFRDCEFTRNDGMGFGSRSLALHCLFTDQWFNSFDVNLCRGFTMRNSIVRRGNRANADDDSTGNKCDLATDVTFDGLIDYDNVGPGLWFDTACNNWTVENSTFFANHGAKNWFQVSAQSGVSASTFTATGQDGEAVHVGTRLLAIAGTAANLGHKTTVTAVHGYNPQTITVSPEMPSTPAAGDVFAGQHGSGGSAVGVMSEANPNGTFIHNVTYNNTGSGFFDADSGDGYGVNKPGLTIVGNQFNYDGIAFRDINGGAGNPTRDLGPATIRNNRFKMGSMTGRNAFHPGGTNYLLGYPAQRYKIEFDHNVYDPDPGYKGSWADWYLWAGGPKTNYHAFSLAELQNPKTWNQDHHSSVGKVAFRGSAVASFDWPTGGDTDWTHIFHPNNRFGARQTIHQVKDDETPYIEEAIAGRRPGQTVKLRVFGHTPVRGKGPYTCEVFDYSGRWVRLTLKNAATAAALEARVPGYAVLNSSSITVRLTSTDPYDLAASYVTR
nr:hypothetical protein [Armatimonadota bacterium]